MATLEELRTAFDAGRADISAAMACGACDMRRFPVTHRSRRPVPSDRERRSSGVALRVEPRRTKLTL